MFTGLLNISQGCSFSSTFNATDVNGNYYNLSGLTGYAPLSLYFGQSGVLDNFNVNIIGPASGYYQISLTPLQTTNYPVTQGVYEVDFFDQFNSGTIQFIAAQGYININPQLVPSFYQLPTGNNRASGIIT